MKRIYSLGLLAVLAVGCSGNPFAPGAQGGSSMNTLNSIADEPPVGDPKNTCSMDAPAKFTANPKAYDADKGTASVDFGATRVWGRTEYRFAVEGWTDTQFVPLSDHPFPPGTYTATVYGFAKGCENTNTATVTFTVNGPKAARFTNPAEPYTPVQG